MTKDTEKGAARRGNRRVTAAWVGAATLLLLAPAAAMRFTDEVNWDLADFVVAGALLFGAGGAYEAAARMSGRLAYRAAVGVAAATALLLTWINLAVGVIGSEDDPANLMFAGVVAVALAGAALARLRPGGMARALAATALAQATAAVVALFNGWGAGGAGWPLPLIVLSGGFAGLWLLSAWLFHLAGRGRPAGAAA